MKRIHLFYLLLALLVFAACKEETPPELKVDFDWPENWEPGTYANQRYGYRARPTVADTFADDVTVLGFAKSYDNSSDLDLSYNITHIGFVDLHRYKKISMDTIKIDGYEAYNLQCTALGSNGQTIYYNWVCLFEYKHFIEFLLQCELSKYPDYEDVFYDVLSTVSIRYE